MPFKSKAQERYFNANRAKLERQGVNVAEWNGRIPAERVIDVERVTGVPREILRPDLYRRGSR